jgi:hypothetical protein
MRGRIVKGMRRGLILLAVFVAGALALRAFDTQRGPPLDRWHTYVPHDLRAEQIDALDWRGYLAEEDRLFDMLRTEVTQKLGPGERVPINRYFEGSPIYPAHLSQDFNRSYVLEPDAIPGAPQFCCMA